jgi:alpha-1,6-mannosyltransferase
VGTLLAPDPRKQLAPHLGLFLAGALTSILAARILTASSPRFLLFCGALLRATLLLRAPELSDDIYRYLWDGRLGSLGISPYAVPPNDPAISGAAPDLWPRLAHRDATSVYPPVAQAAFRVFGAGGRTILWKAFVAASDLSIVALLARAGGPTAMSAAALYAFHPLPVTEAAGEGHVDSLGVALLVAGLVYLSRRRRGLSGIAFAMSVLTKYISIAAAIPLVRRGRCKFLAAAAATGAVLWLAASSAGFSPARGLSVYATRWDFNSPIYGAAVRGVEASALDEKAKAWFETLKASLGHPVWTKNVFPFFYPAFFARLFLAALIVFALAGIAWRVRDTEAAVFASIGALLVLSPTLYPWYLLWVLPFAAKRREPAFLYLSFLAPFSYALLYPVPGLSRQLVHAIEFIPFAILLARTLVRSRSRAVA